MTQNALSISHLISGTILGMFRSKKANIDMRPISPQGYKLIKTFVPHDPDKHMNVGLFKNQNKKRVIIKEYRYQHKDLFYWHILNEVEILRVLQNVHYKNDGYEYSFPRLISFSETKNYSKLITKFVTGNPLSQFSDIEKHKIINGVLDMLSFATRSLGKSDLKRIPKRSTIIVLVSFPYFAIMALTRITNKTNFIKLIFQFYKYYFDIRRFIEPKLVLSHRDLHPNNILLHNKKITVIDPAIMVMWDREADLAIVSYYYSPIIKISTLTSWITDRIKTKSEARRFMSLCIYYTIQSLAVCSTNSSDYRFTENYLTNYLPHIINKIGELKKYGQ